MPEPIRVYLGFPTGEPILYSGTAAGIEACCRPDGPVQLVAKRQAVWTGSNFNALWALALDSRDRGEANHLALIHSDNEPPPFWLDVLAEEKAKAGVEMISAVVPIKTGDGSVTSTAVGSRREPWAPARNLTAPALWSLPTTFTTRDVAATDDDVLLCNNGLILIDLRGAWADMTRPRMERWVWQWWVDVVKTPAGHNVEFRPEDWEFSRFLDRQSVPYAATTALDVGHWGHHCWRIPRPGADRNGPARA